MFGPDIGTGQHVEQGRLAGVGVADDRRGFKGGPTPARPLLVALRADLLDLPVEVAHPFPDAPALHFDLLLAKPTAGPHSPTTPADLAVVGIGADQPRQQVMQPRRFDLEPALVRARVLGKDLEDDLRAIENPGLDLELEVALLARAEVFIADHDVEFALQLQVAQRSDLAHAEEMRRVDLGSPLHVGAHDLGPRSPREVGKLGHLVAHPLWSGARQQDPDEIRPLARTPGRDHSGASAKSRRSLGFRGDFRA